MMLLQHFTVLIMLTTSLKVSTAAILTPSTDIQTCPAGVVTSEQQTLSFVCNDTRSIYWEITINGISENVIFNYDSPLDVNGYNGGNGIRVTLMYNFNQHLTSVATVTVPPFDIAAYSATLKCDSQSRALLPAGRNKINDQLGVHYLINRL